MGGLLEGFDGLLERNQGAFDRFSETADSTGELALGDTLFRFLPSSSLPSA